jgi:hypothetical protein
MKPRAKELQEFFNDGQFLIPSLHVVGSADQIITPNQSESLAERFVNPSFVRHGSSHTFPKTTEHIQEVVHFIKSKGQNGQK